MTRKNCLCVVLVMLAVAMITSGKALEFLTQYRTDIEKKQEVVVSVRNEYASFSNQTQMFKEQIEEFNNLLGKYLEEVAKNNEITVQVLNDTGELLKNIDDSTVFLKETCIKKEINDSEVQTKCDVFEKNYETIVNTYVKMIVEYNRAIEEYNDWSVEEQIETYSSSIVNSWIDFNQDGVYLGTK